LFEIPVTATSTSSTAPVTPTTTTCTSAATANVMLLPSLNSTSITVVHTCDVVATSDETGKILMLRSTTNTTTGDVMLTCTTTTELSCMGTHHVTIAGGSVSQLLLSSKSETEPLQCFELQSQSFHMATSEYSPESGPEQNKTPNVASTAAATTNDVPSMEKTCSVTSASLPVTNKGVSHPNASVPVAACHVVIDSTNAVYKSDVTQDLLLASNQSIQDDNAVKANGMYINIYHTCMY